MTDHTHCQIPCITGSRFGHCGACHRNFWGEGAFDNHRRGGHNGGRYCVDPATDDETTETGKPISDWWRDDRGYWHEGTRGYWRAA